MRTYGFLLLVFIHSQVAYSMGTFESNNSGTWNSSGSWTLTSGSDADGIPDADDDVTIVAGHTIRITATGACNDLTIAGGTMAFNASVTISVNNDVLVNDDESRITGYSNNQILSINGNMTIPAGYDLTMTAIRLSVAGNLSVSGSLSLSGWGQTRSFGNTTINPGGSMTLSGGDDYIFTGDLANNGTFSAGSHGQSFSFTGTAGTISGSGLISIFDGLVDAPAVYTNQGNLQIRNSLTGTGSFTNGLGGMLELQNGGPFSVSTFSASATGNTITYTGYGNPTAFSGNYYNLTLDKSSGSLSFGSSLSIQNDLTITSGILQLGAVTLTVGNDLNIEGGELTPGNASTVLNIQGDLSMTSGEYDHNNGDVNVTGNLVVTGGAFNMDGAASTLDVANASFSSTTLTLNNGDLTTSGDFTTDTGVTLDGRGADVEVTGTFNLLDGDIEFASGNFDPVNIAVATSKSLVITNASVSSTGTTTINGAISFTGSSGTRSFGNIQVNSGGNWSVTQDIDFSISGNITNNGTFNGDPGYGSGVYSLTSETGSINGTSTIAMRNVQIQSPAEYTNNGSLEVTRSITGTGSLINGNNASLTYSGNSFTISDFTASAPGNTVIFNHAGDQNLPTTTDTDNNYHNLVINTTAAGNDVTLTGNTTIDNQLTLTLGDLFLSNNRLTMADGATISGGSTDSYVGIDGSGVLRQNYSAAGATLAFPIGDAGDYSPITAFTINSATFGADAYLEFDLTDAVQPNRNAANTPVGDDDGTVAVDYISRYWTVTANNITNPDYDADYVYLDTDIIGTESNMVGALYRMHPTLGILDWFVTGTVNPSDNTVSLTNADAFGDLYAMDNTLSRLPIVLVSFKAQKETGRVVLNWVTASEENNAFFTIERSVNGKDFEDVLMRDGAGNSERFIHYEATDVNPPAGRVFYRLKQTDFNGTFEYSDLVSVDVPGPEKEPLTFAIMGNLVSTGDELKLNRSQAGEAMIFLQSVDGRKSITYEIDAQSEAGFTLQLPVSLTRGMYVLQLVQNGQRLSQKLVIQ